MDDIVMEIIIALVIGMIIGLIIALVEKSKLKTVRANNLATAYIVDGTFQVTDGWERFMYKQVERREKPKHEPPEQDR